MRLPNRIRRSLEDPLLKIGATAMVLALGFAVVVAAYALLGGSSERAAAAVESATKPGAEPLVRSDPGFEPWVEKDIPPPKPASKPQTEQTSETTADPQPTSAPKPDPPPDQPSDSPPDQPPAPPEPQPERPEPLPVKETGYPLPTDRQVEAANRPRHYELAPGAIIGLTVDSIGLHDVPVLDSDSRQALDKGVIHVPDTSLPWSQTPERNVYLAGHRLGWPGTGSHLVFYRLNELGKGDDIVLRDRDGKKYRYRVIDTFIVNPGDTWVMGRVRGRDLLTLQTCTPIPTFEKRLIVRAERV